MSEHKKRRINYIKTNIPGKCGVEELCPNCMTNTVEKTPYVSGFYKNYCFDCFCGEDFIETVRYNQHDLYAVLREHWIKVKWSGQLFLDNLKHSNVRGSAVIPKFQANFLIERLKWLIRENKYDENWNKLCNHTEWIRVMGGWKVWFMTMVQVCRKFSHKENYKQQHLSKLPILFFWHVLQNYINY